MKQAFSKFGLYIWIVVAGIICLGNLYADNAAASESNGADIMVVLDLSGSMKSAQKEGRFDAFMRWTESFTTSRDRIGIVAMGHGATLVAPLTERARFSFADYTERLTHRAKYTDVAAGLENAYYELKTNTHPGRLKIVILLSDAQIDMPKGQWDLDNSLRYLESSLIPAMQREQIKIISIVPEGLQANFQLLQELAQGTNGVYFRGLPADAVAVRETHVSVSIAAEPKQPIASSTNINESVHKKMKDKEAIVAAPTAREEKSSKSSVSLAHVSAAPSDSIQKGILVLGTVLAVGFALVFIAIFVLFKKTATKKNTDNSDLMEVLEEVQSLKKASIQSEEDSKQFMDDIDETGTGELDFGEPKEQLSVSMVAPFLDYENISSELPSGPLDEITSKPAFAMDDFEESNLSVSNMESLIGTVTSPLSEKE